MPALQIGAVVVKATDFQMLANERGGGGLRRTLSGDLRGRTDWSKRAWSGSALAEDGAELAALLAVADPDVDVSVSGDLIGATVTCRVEVTGDTPYIRTGASTWHYIVPLSIRET